METTINGHIVSHDDATEVGVRYLIRIGAAESKVFFDEAYNRGSVIFEDHMGYKFKLTHNGSEYDLTKA
jgi:hypothetical protein